MNYFITILLIFYTTSCENKSKATSKVKTNGPASLLVSINTLIQEKKYEDIKKHIYDINLYPNIPLSKIIIEEIKKERKEYTGDFSFSREALEILIEKYSNEFTSKFESPTLLHFKKQDPFLNEIDQSDFFLLNINSKTRILVVKHKAEYKLLFWEGLNHLIQGKNRAGD